MFSLFPFRFSLNFHGNRTETSLASSEFIQVKQKTKARSSHKKLKRKLRNATISSTSTDLTLWFKHRPIISHKQRYTARERERNLTWMTPSSRKYERFCVEVRTEEVQQFAERERERKRREVCFWGFFWKRNRETEGF